VHREAGRLVHGDHPIVLEQQRGLERPCDRRARRRRRRRANGWNAHHVTEREARVRPYAPAIHPHLAAAQDPVDVAFRHAFQHPEQEIVDALARAGLVHRDPRRGVLA